MARSQNNERNRDAAWRSRYSDLPSVEEVLSQQHPRVARRRWRVNPAERPPEPPKGESKPDDEPPKSTSKSDDRKAKAGSRNAKASSRNARAGSRNAKAGSRDAKAVASSHDRELVVGGPGTELLSGGGGNDVLEAPDGTPDTVSCGAGVDRATVDNKDAVSSSCEKVRIGR